MNRSTPIDGFTPVMFRLPCESRVTGGAVERVVLALQIGRVVVHAGHADTAGYWVVTHAPSGRSMLVCARLTDALAVAADLHALESDTWDFEELPAPPAFAAVINPRLAQLRDMTSVDFRGAVQ